MKKIIITILLVVLCLGIVGGGIAGIVKLVDQGKFDTKKISNLAYGIGGLDGNGKYMNTDRSIYTKDAFECQGLNCTLAFDNEVSYQIYFYDQNNDFVHTTGSLTGAFVSDSVPFFAKYARIVITPNDDNKVSMLEVMKYAKQLKTTVYREQGFKNYTEDLFVVGSTSSVLGSNGDVSSSQNDADVVSEFINISSYKEALIFRTEGQALSSGFKVHFYDGTKTHQGYIDMTMSDSSFVSSEGYHYYCISFASLSYVPTFVRYSTSSVNSVGFYCR